MAPRNRARSFRHCAPDRNALEGSDSVQGFPQKVVVGGLVGNENGPTLVRFAPDLPERAWELVGVGAPDPEEDGTGAGRYHRQPSRIPVEAVEGGGVVLVHLLHGRGVHLPGLSPPYLGPVCEQLPGGPLHRPCEGGRGADEATFRTLRLVEHPLVLELCCKESHVHEGVYCPIVQMDGGGLLDKDQAGVGPSVLSPCQLLHHGPCGTKDLLGGGSVRPVREAPDGLPVPFPHLFWFAFLQAKVEGEGGVASGLPRVARVEPDQTGVTEKYKPQLLSEAQGQLHRDMGGTTSLEGVRVVHS